MRIALLLALVACGDNLPDPRPLRSGTGIKLVYNEYSDGTRQRVLGTYYDTGRDLACQPVRWSDGARYCTPPADEAIYLDPGCTMAVGRATSPEPPRYFTTMYSVLGTAYPSNVYAAGELTTRPAERWSLEDGFCKGPIPVDDAYEYYTLGAQLSGLVRIKRSDPHGDGPLQLVDDYSDDGMHAPIALSERKTGECRTPESANAEIIDCVPYDSELASYFHDGACSEPIVTVTGSTFPAIVGTYNVLTGCSTYYPLADELLAPQLFQHIVGTCSEVLPPNGVRFFATGAALTLPHVTREREVADRRLLRIDRVSGELRIEDTLLYDSVLETDCAADDGRCVPVTDAMIHPLFTDDLCTSPIDVALVPTRPCDPHASFARRDREYFPIGPRYSEPLYELSTGDTCRTYVPQTPFAVHAVGAPIDDFATYSVAIDP